MKQLEIKKFFKNQANEKIKDDIKTGKVVTCVIENVLDTGLEVLVDGNLSGFIKRVALSRDKGEQKSSRFAKGDKVDAMIVELDKDKKTVTLSIKALEEKESKEALKKYGSTDSGAKLADIFGPILKKKKDKN